MAPKKEDTGTGSITLFDRASRQSSQQPRTALGAGKNSTTFALPMKITQHLIIESATKNSVTI